MPFGEWHRLWVIEADVKDGRATAGQAEVIFDRDEYGFPFIGSAETGGAYAEPGVVGGEVEVWSAGRGFIVMFAGEGAMRAGGRLLAAELRGLLPGSVRRAIAGPGGELEAGL